MNQKYSVDFATFCYAGDTHRLHAPGQLKRQVQSNKYGFSQVMIIYQDCEFKFIEPFGYHIHPYQIADVDLALARYGIDISKPQYVSKTDKAHHWKYHVVNHLAAASLSMADYIVFADNDCWMTRQPCFNEPDKYYSWVEVGIHILEDMPSVFVVSPNDGEPERRTSRFSQQMFLARTDEFCNADFNQPGWDGNVNIPGGPMPEYWGMLEGRMELHCRVTGQYRYVLGPEYRYWHFNRLNEQGLFETDLSKY